MWESIIGPVSQVIHDVLNRVLPPEKMTEQEKAVVNAQIDSALLQADTTEMDNRIKVLVTEMSGNWLQRSWRPILMLSIIGIVVNNYILFPYLSMFTVKVTILVLPEDLWSLLKIGVGGYVVGRSAEKIAATVKGN